MWFSRRQILVEIHLLYDNTVPGTNPKVFCKSSVSPVVKHNIDGNIQKISFTIEAPEIFILDVTNSKNITSSICKVLIDGTEINNENLNKVFKIATNRKNLPITVDNIKNFQYKFGNKLIGNSYMVFDIYENDSISYLLSLGNKMIY